MWPAKVRGSREVTREARRPIREDEFKQMRDSLATQVFVPVDYQGSCRTGFGLLRPEDRVFEARLDG